MGYFFIYLLIIIINIFAVLAVLKIRRNKANDADVISDATLIEENLEKSKVSKKPFTLFNNRKNNNLFVEYEDIEVDKSEIVYDGQLLDIAVQKKIVKKKGNWYLYGDEKLGYGKEKTKFFLLENPIIANEISSLVNNVIDVKVKNSNKDVQNSEMIRPESTGSQLYTSENPIQNQRSLGLINRELEVELSEVYVKANTLKKYLENALGTEVRISIDISERFNPLIADQESYINDIVSMLKELDYLSSAVRNISKNANYLGIEVTEQMLREKLNLMTSNRFSIVFTKKPVAKHRIFAKLKFDQPVNKNLNNASGRQYRTARVANPRQRPLVPLAIGLLLAGFFIVVYTINQTFFSTSVINDEQELLEIQFSANNANLSELRSKNLAETTSLQNLNEIDEFEESVISIATKTLTNQAAKAEFLPDVVGRLTILSANINHYVVFGVEDDKLEYGPGYIVGTSLPGTGGNFAIAGHRTTYGAPFGNLDRVQLGETIIFQTNTNEYKYKVVDVQIVSPTDNFVLQNYGDDRITLTTCHPKFSAKQRLIVVGQLEKVEVYG
ncbi:MAG: sortase [Alphaproteobacteria bacterium]|nr:sortase [Alphaproteobacteria bacterium]